MNSGETLSTLGKEASRWWRKLLSFLLEFIAWAIPPFDEWRKKTAGDYRQRGVDAYQKGNYEQAFGHLSKALELMERDVETHLWLGRVYYMRGEYANAERCFRTALKWDYNYMPALEWMGYTLQARRNFAEAVYFFLRYLAHDPMNGDVLLNLGASLHDSGKYEEAIAYYKKAEEVNPQNPLIPENRALAYYALGQVDQAIEHIRLSLKLNPTSSRAQSFLGLALNVNGDQEEALRSYRRAIELDPKNADAMLATSLLLSKSAAHKEAAEYARQALEIYQKQGNAKGMALAYWDLGWYYYRMGQLDESVQASRKCVEIDRSFFGARFNLALALLHQGRVDEARREYLEGAGSVKLASDLKTSAIDDLEAALRVQPLVGGAEILDELQAKYKAMRSKRGLDSLAQARV